MHDEHNPELPAGPFAEESITLGRSLGYWLAAFIALTIAVKLQLAIDGYPSLVTIAVYFALGVTLNRLVLRRLVSYHQNYNTLDSVSGTKLAFAALWPLRYPVLFFKLAVDRHL